MILTASGYSGGGAFIFLHAPAVVAGAFLFSCRVACGVLCAPLPHFSCRVYTFIPFYVSFHVRPVWRSCGYSHTFVPGVWRSQRLHIARLRRSGMPIAAPYCSPCRVRAAFSFTGCNFTRLYFSFVLRPPRGVVCRLRLACVGVWRLPWPSVGRSGTGWACISSRRFSRLGASGAVVGRSGSRHGRRRSGRVQRGQADFFRGLP